MISSVTGLDIFDLSLVILNETFCLQARTPSTSEVSAVLDLKLKYVNMDLQNIEHKSS